MASHTFRTGRPASSASTAVRPPSGAKTWSRAMPWARMDPKWRSRRDQNSCRRTPPTLTRGTGGRAHRLGSERDTQYRLGGLGRDPAGRDRAHPAHHDHPADQELPRSLSAARAPRSPVPRPHTSRPHTTASGTTRAAETAETSGKPPTASNGPPASPGHRRAQPHEQVRAALGGRPYVRPDRLGDQRRAGDQAARPAQAEEEQPGTELPRRTRGRSAGKGGRRPAGGRPPPRPSRSGPPGRRAGPPAARRGTSRRRAR